LTRDWRSGTSRDGLEDELARRRDRSPEVPAAGGEEVGVLGERALATRYEREHVEVDVAGFELPGIFGNDELEEEQLRRWCGRCPDRGEDRNGFLVGPVVDDVGQEIAV